MGWDMESTGVVGHVGRKGLRLALTNGHGNVISASMRFYDADQGSSVSGGLSAFQRDMAIDRLPQRLAIAVAGLARGDAISITHTRWFVSRSGLQAMLGQPPLILNDFEAEAWALTGNFGTLLPIGSAPVVKIQQPGTYCVIGITSGLGVSVITRERTGALHVLATEAGHAGFAPGSQHIAEQAAHIFPGHYPIVAEHLISSTGLVTIYNALAAMKGVPKRTISPEEITRTTMIDPIARESCEFLSEAFMTYVSSLVMTYGAWDGVIIAGGLAQALAQTLASPRIQSAFSGSGKYAKLLAAVPRSLVSIEHGELLGAAQALQRQP